jgi:hypothetical protein
MWSVALLDPNTTVTQATVFVSSKDCSWWCGAKPKPLTCETKQWDDAGFLAGSSVGRPRRGGDHHSTCHLLSVILVQRSDIPPVHQGLLRLSAVGWFWPASPRSRNIASGAARLGACVHAPHYKKNKERWPLPTLNTVRRSRVDDRRHRHGPYSFSPGGVCRCHREDH